MNQIKSENHTFNVVNEIPLGTSIWSIGNHMIEGYLPIVYIGGDNHHTVIGEKMAIKCEDAQKILEVAIIGLNTVRKMREYLEKAERYTEQGREEFTEEVKFALEVLLKVNGYQNLK